MRRAHFQFEKYTDLEPNIWFVSNWMTEKVLGQIRCYDENLWMFRAADDTVFTADGLRHIAAFMDEHC